MKTTLSATAAQGCRVDIGGSILYGLRKRFHHAKGHQEITKRLERNDGPASRALSDYGQQDV